jgi:hypothetical protein
MAVTLIRQDPASSEDMDVIMSSGSSQILIGPASSGFMEFQPPKLSAVQISLWKASLSGRHSKRLSDFLRNSSQNCSHDSRTKLMSFRRVLLIVSRFSSR